MANLVTHNIVNLDCIGVVRVTGVPLHDNMLPQSGMSSIKPDTHNLSV